MSSRDALPTLLAWGQEAVKLRSVPLDVRPYFSVHLCRSKARPGTEGTWHRNVTDTLTLQQHIIEQQRLSCIVAGAGREEGSEHDPRQQRLVDLQLQLQFQQQLAATALGEGKDLDQVASASRSDGEVHRARSRPSQSKGQLVAGRIWKHRATSKDYQAGFRRV